MESDGGCGGDPSGTRRRAGDQHRACLWCGLCLFDLSFYLEKGEESISEAEEDEEDRVEEAPGLQINSRLACQCTIEGDGPIEVRVPSWNRNAIKEVPH